MTDYQDIPIHQTYSLRMEDIVRVSDLAERMNIAKSMVIRNAVEAYYQQLEAAEAAANPTTPEQENA
jgi:predicted DNA-binding protein